MIRRDLASLHVQCCYECEASDELLVAEGLK